MLFILSYTKPLWVKGLSETLRKKKKNKSIRCSLSPNPSFDSCVVNYNDMVQTFVSSKSQIQMISWSWQKTPGSWGWWSAEGPLWSSSVLRMAWRPYQTHLYNNKMANTYTQTHTHVVKYFWAFVLFFTFNRQIMNAQREQFFFLVVKSELINRGHLTTWPIHSRFEL